MTGLGPKPKNPLSPYSPSETPSVPGKGRKWVAVLLALMFVSGVLYQFLLLFL